MNLKESSNLIAEAVFTALESYGLGILADSQNLESALRDLLSQDDSPSRVLLANCDDALLAPLAPIAEGEASEVILGQAASQISSILSVDRMVDESAAASIAVGITGGIAKYMSIEGKSAENCNVQVGHSRQEVQQSQDDSQQADDDTDGNASDGTAEETSPVEKKRHVRRVVSIVAIALFAILALIVVLIHKEKEVLFFTGDTSVESSDPCLVISAPKSGTFTLPNCEYEWEHHIFVGWRATDKRGDYEKPVLESGTTVETDSSATYYAAWETEIIYDGNGADEDRQISKWTDSAGKFKLEKCPFKRVGYEFAGWSTYLEDVSERIPAGSEMETDDESVVYYAVWIPSTRNVVRVSIDKPDDNITMSVDKWDKEPLSGYSSTARVGNISAIVKNDTDKSLRYDAELTIYSESGSKICKRYDSAHDVASGDTGVLVFGNVVVGAKAEVTVKTSEESNYSTNLPSQAERVYRMPTKYSGLLTYPLEYYRGDSPDEVEIVEVSYDEKGRLATKSVEYAGWMPLSYVTHYEYDDENRLSAVVAKVGEGITYDWILEYSEDGKYMNATCVNESGIDGSYVNETYDDEGQILTRDFMVGFQEYDSTVHDFVNGLIPIIGHEAFIYNDNEQLEKIDIKYEGSMYPKGSSTETYDISYDKNGFIERIKYESTSELVVYESSFKLSQGHPVLLNLMVRGDYDDDTDYVYDDNGMLSQSYKVYADSRSPFNMETAVSGYSIMDGNEMQEHYVAIGFEDIAPASGIVPQLAINSIIPIHPSILGHQTDVWAGLSQYSFDGIWFVYPDIWSLNQKWFEAHGELAE